MSEIDWTTAGHRAAQGLDPSNVINRIREAFSEVGYGWVTSHVFRKTVASVLTRRTYR